MADMCRIMDAQYRLYRASARDASMLTRLVKQEDARSARSQRLLTSREAQLQGFARSGGASVGPSPASSAMVVAESNSVVEKVLSGLAGQYDRQMRGLAEASREEEHARLVYEAAVQRRNASAAEALKTEQIYAALQTQVKHVSKVAAARVELERYNHSSATARLGLLDSIQRLIAHLSRDYVRTQIGKKAFEMYHSLFMWWRSLCGVDGVGDSQAAVNIRVGLELVRLCRQLLPAAAADETGALSEGQSACMLMGANNCTSVVGL